MGRHTMYNESVARLTELEKQNSVFVIRPSAPIEIGKIEKDPDKQQSVYELGVSDMLACLQKLKAYMA